MKKRLTITLSENTLRKVDQHIDGHKLRNRSHAIEYLLEQKLQPSISTAVILAGGKHDNTKDEFRPLQLLDNKPLILHTLEHLVTFGITKIFILTNQVGQELEQVVTPFQSRAGIEVIVEAQPQGTAGALRSVAPKLGGVSFLVWAGDVLSSIDLENFAHFHHQHGALITMAVKPRVTRPNYDNVFVQGNTIVSFEKSRPNEQEVSIANAGIYLFEQKALQYIPENKTPAMLEEDVFPQLTESNKLLAYPFQGIWFDITSEESYKEATERMNS